MTILAKNIQLAGAPQISNHNWQKEQSDDKDIGPVIKLVKQK